MTNFALKPTENPDTFRQYADHIINAESGIGIEELLAAVDRFVPGIDNPEVQTEKAIIYTKRYECPCCPTHITALVDLSFQGLMTDEWKEKKGLYQVFIGPDYWSSSGETVTRVEKLNPTLIHQNYCSPLPKKQKPEK